MIRSVVGWPSPAFAYGALAGLVLGDVARRLWHWWRVYRFARQELGIIPPQYASSRALRRQYARGMARGMVAHDTRVRRMPRPTWRMQLARGAGPRPRRRVRLAAEAPRRELANGGRR